MLVSTCKIIFIVLYLLTGNDPIMTDNDSFEVETTSSVVSGKAQYYIYTVSFLYSFFIFYNSRGCFEFPERKRLIYNLPIGGLKLLVLFDLTKSSFFFFFIFMSGLNPLGCSVKRATIW